MAQIQSPETYADGQQVTAARLNNQTNGAILLPGAVTDQTALTANTVASGDTVLLHDASASALRKATAGDLLGSGLPVTTSGITGASGVDLAITPAAGQKVDVGGAFESTTSNTTGNATIGGSLTVTGASTLTGNVIADNGFTSNGVANFTGSLQVNGSTGYVLTEIVEENVPLSFINASTTTWGDLFTSASHTKPVGEIWVLELDSYWIYSTNTQSALRLVRTSDSNTLDQTLSVEGGSVGYWHYENTHFKTVFQASVSFTSTFKVQGIISNAGYQIILAPNNTGTFPAWIYNSVVQHLFPPKFRIYKYKTA